MDGVKARVRRNMAAAAEEFAGYRHGNAPWLARRRELSVWRALGVFALIFVPVWGLGCFRAVRHLLGRSPEPLTVAQEIDRNLLNLGLSAIVLVLAVLLLHRHGAAASTRWSASRRNMGKEAAAAVCFAAVSLISANLVDHLLTWFGMSLSNPNVREATGVDGLLEVLSNGFLGGVEEPVFALLVVLLRRAGMSWPGVIAIASLLRWSFHVYYGWFSVNALIWGAGVAIVYALTGRVWGLMLAHVLHNAFITSFRQHNTVTTWVVVALVVITLVLAAQEGRARSREKRTSAASV